MSYLISVIVPVYNVEIYLPECIDSILSQDYSDLQIILIDDGSTDASGYICDTYAAKDPRIQVIHQKNGGAAAAKNAGLRAACGEYLSFVDSDDFLEPGAYSHMVNLVKQYNADVAQCAFRDIFRDRTVDRIFKPGLQTYDTPQYLQMYTKDWTCALLWDKLYRRDVFYNIFFEEGHKIDDEFFTYRGMINAKKIICNDQIVYNYRKRRSSIMNSPESRQQIILDRIEFLEVRRQNIIVRYPELRKEFDLHFLSSMIMLSNDHNFCPECIARLRNALSHYFREKGNTFPPKDLWLPLAKLWTRKESNIPLQDIPSNTLDDLEKYFD